MQKYPDGKITVKHGKTTPNSMKYFIIRWNLYKRERRLRLIKNEISVLYVNKELIAFFQMLSTQIKSVKEKEYYLIYCKKIVEQNPRLPQAEHYAAFKEEYDVFFNAIKTEQISYNPIKWLEAELEFIRFTATSNIKDIAKQEDTCPSTNPQQDWISFKEMLIRFGTSKMALRRRMDEGMAFIKFGNQLRFYPKVVDEWFSNQN